MSDFPSRFAKRWAGVAARVRGRSPLFLARKAGQLCLRKVRKFTYPLEQRTISADRVAALFAARQTASIREHLLQRVSLRFCIDQSEVAAILERLSRDDPAYRERIIRRADDVCNHRLPVLGRDEMELGETIDWSRDYRSGFDWPSRYFLDYDLLQFSRRSDVRVAWELNRLHFLVDLGKAYRATGDLRYVSEYQHLVTEWQRCNPVAFSIAWGCAMEAAIRSVNLIVSLFLFLPAPELEDSFVVELLRTLILHARFIERNLEYSDLRGNHYFSNLVGLLSVGLFLPEYPESSHWVDWAAAELNREILGQTYQDGVDHEGSIPYHRLVADMGVFSALLLRKHGRRLSQEAMARLERMLEFTMAYIRPDGTAPVWGDNDDARLVTLGDQPPADHRALLSTGAVLFARGDFGERAGRLWEESAWLLGPGAWDAFDALPGRRPPQSTAFPEGGFFVMRSGDDYVLIDCGDVGLRGRGAHGHHDVLSFEAALQGETLICDAGCSSYTANRADRLELLSAAAHNVAVVDGMEPAAFREAAFIQAGATPYKVIEWRTEPDADDFAGEHGGYERPASRLTYRRSVHLDKAAHRLQITDEFSGSGRHNVDVRFHCASGCVLTTDEHGVHLYSPMGVAYRLEAEGGGEWSIVPGRIFPRYAVQQPIQVAVYRAQIDAPAALRFVLAPTKS